MWSLSFVLLPQCYPPLLEPNQCKYQSQTFNFPNYKLNKLIFFIKPWPQIFCYNIKNWWIHPLLLFHSVCDCKVKEQIQLVFVVLYFKLCRQRKLLSQGALCLLVQRWPQSLVAYLLHPLCVFHLTTLSQKGMITLSSERLNVALLKDKNKNIPQAFFLYRKPFSSFKIYAKSTSPYWNRHEFGVLWYSIRTYRGGCTFCIQELWIYRHYVIHLQETWAHYELPINYW